MTGVLELYVQGIRGTMPGLLHPVQDLIGAFSSGSLTQGTDELVGRSILALRVAAPSCAMHSPCVPVYVPMPAAASPECAAL